MAKRPERTEMESTPFAGMPPSARSMRLTKEQLAAAERTLNYHLRKLQSRMAANQRSSEGSTRSEH